MIIFQCRCNHFHYWSKLMNQLFIFEWSENSTVRNYMGKQALVENRFMYLLKIISQLDLTVSLAVQPIWFSKKRAKLLSTGGRRKEEKQTVELKKKREKKNYDMNPCDGERRLLTEKRIPQTTRRLSRRLTQRREKSLFLAHFTCTKTTKNTRQSGQERTVTQS